MLSSIASNMIDKKRCELEKLSLDIWNNPERGFKELKACQWIADMLRQNGFDVNVGVAGIPTAIKASFGSGYPVIGFLGEYDAMPGLSQKVKPQRDPVIPDDYGHACGHNLLGVAHLGAVIGIREAMKKGNIKGTVIFYGCPAEEGGNGKIHMAKGGAFDDLDCSVHFHPGMMNTIGITGTAMMSTRFHFKGKAAHPSIDPYNGRSALKAAELMNIGANYMREHVKNDASISYIITDGGKAPNAIPDKASVWYMLRADEKKYVEEIHERIIKVAQGAALMTETTVEEEFLGCTYQPMNNKVLQKVIGESFKKIPQEEYTNEELEFAKALNDTDPKLTDTIRKKYGFRDDEIIHTGLLPIQPNRGSTDVGDVQHIAPGIAFRVACYPIGVRAHTWVATASAGHSIGLKGMIRGAKIMADFSLRLLNDPSICEEAKKEFELSMKGGKYISSIPINTQVPYDY